MRTRNYTASYIVKTSEGKVPLPSHFSPDEFTLGAFDNFDHREATTSGIGGSHDTVFVLYQKKPAQPNRKPKLSEFGIVHGSKTFKEELACQKIQNFLKTSRKNQYTRLLSRVISGMELD